jgi:GH25 family lysozyme M1 (1,4-beta-N-acetylmuramidase)
MASFASACGDSASPSGGREHVTSSTSEALVDVCAGPSTVQGIDVSHYQGTIDWAAEKARGREFGIASVGDGTYQDPTFATNWNAMKAAGVIRGAYQFFEPAGDPVQQADILIGKVGVLGDGDLPATLDVETAGGQSGATIAAHIRTWSDRVEQATGRKPMIYTGPYFWEASVGSSAFAANPLWIADYGVTCPKLPTPWTGFKFWQYGDSGGTLDVDVFNGTLAELQAFARPPNAPPQGYLDTADCSEVAGWSQDTDVATQAIAVHVYFNGAAGAAGAIAVPLEADHNRSDLCGPLGSCDHGFAMTTPLGLKDGKPHEVFAYGIDEAGGANTLLTGSPKSFTCAPPPPPANVVKRWITSPTALGAWRFSTLDDLAHYSDAVIATFPKGADLPLAPTVVIADDGSPSVWVVDGSERRHVIDPASMAAWRFAAPVKWPAAKVNALTHARDFPSAPMLVQGGAPAIYMLDSAPPAAADAGAGSPGPVPAGGGGNGDAGAASSDATGGAGADSASVGCSTSARAIARQSSGALFAFGAASLVAAMARRRRRGGDT